MLKTIGDAVPVRLMKRDLLFAVERLTALWTSGVRRFMSLRMASESPRMETSRQNTCLFGASLYKSNSQAPRADDGHTQL
jgi:hypothetical protein